MVSRDQDPRGFFYTQFARFNPLDAMGICLKKQKLMYKVLAPSSITPYGLMEALD